MRGCTLTPSFRVARGPTTTSSCRHVETAAADFDTLRILQAKLHLDGLQVARWGDAEDASRIARTIDRLHRHGEHVPPLIGDQIPLRRTCLG